MLWLQFSSVQFSRSVVSNSLQPHEPQHARPPCPSPTPRVHTNPRPLSQYISCVDNLASFDHSVQFSHSVVPDSLWPHRLQRARLPCPSPNSWSLLKLMSIELVMPFNHLILCRPLALSLSKHQDLFQWVSSSHHVAKVLEFHLQHQSFQWTPRSDLL